MAVPVLEQSVTASATSGSSIELPPFTTGANVFVGLVFFLADSLQSVSVQGSANLHWQLRSSVDLGGPLNTEFWWATSVDPLIDDVITVTFSGVTSLVTAVAFSVAGALITSPFDGDVSLPSASLAIEQSVSTDAAESMIVGFYRQSSTASPTAGTGFTQLLGEHYLLAEYSTFDEPQTNLDVTVGNGVADIATGIADAIAAVPVPNVLGTAADRIPMTGTIQYMLADFEAEFGAVTELVLDEDDNVLVEPSWHTYEQDIGGTLYRITAINPVISGDVVTFTLQDADPLS